MGKKGPAKHVKRQVAPIAWPIQRKTYVWAVKTSAGPHAFKMSLPLIIVLRDMLQLATTGNEAETLIKQGKVVVDGVTRRDERFPVGVMDVVDLPDSKQRFRVLPIKGGRLSLKPIKGEESEFKLCRIIGKKTTNNGVTQLNLHDGSNLTLKDEDAGYKMNDILQMKVPEREVLAHIKFEEGVQAILTGGRSQGRRGQIIGIGSEPGNKRTVAIRTPDGEDVRTLARYVFTVGKAEPLISLTDGQ